MSIFDKLADHHNHWLAEASRYRSLAPEIVSDKCSRNDLCDLLSFEVRAHAMLGDDHGRLKQLAWLLSDADSCTDNDILVALKLIGLSVDSSGNVWSLRAKS